MFPTRWCTRSASPAMPRAARARVQAYREAGADLPIVYTVVGPGDDAEVVARTIRALAPGSSPA